MVPSASIPAVRQNLSKLTETASQALSTAPSPVGGKAVNGVIAFFMALLSFRGISTPSLPAQGEQRRSSYFNIPRGNPNRDSVAVSPNSMGCVGRLTGRACYSRGCWGADRWSRHIEADVAGYLLGSDCDGYYRRHRTPCRALPLSERKNCRMGLLEPVVNIAHRHRFALNHPLSLTHLKAGLAARTIVSVCCGEITCRIAVKRSQHALSI